MGLFSAILEKLGFNRPAAEAVPAPEVVPAPEAAPSAPAAPAPIAMVDVLGQLEGLAAANPQKLNWKVSIVDLLKLLGLDSSFAARKERLGVSRITITGIAPSWSPRSVIMISGSLI